MNEPIIQLRGVSKSFGKNVVLDGIDLDILPGEITTIIGKSGVGKSVTLKLIVGLLEADEGEILYEGKSQREMSRKERKALKQKFSYMFQNNALFDSMTIFQNVALPLREKTDLSSAKIRERVMERIGQLELTEVAEKYPSQISGGMQKRVALARALITEPEIVFFDEPTTGLDPIRKNAVLNMISHYQKQFGFTAILVSHDIPDVFYISDRVAIVEKARILFQGSPMELETNQDPVVQTFLNSLEILKDELTGLHTYKSFEEQFRSLTSRLREDEQFALILVSIVNLDDIAEHVGHIAAQHIMQALATSLQSHMTASDSAARHGKTELVAMLSSTGMKEAMELCTAVGSSLRSEEIFSETRYQQLGRSFCIDAGAAVGTRGSDLDKLLEQARYSQQPIACLISKDLKEAI